MARGDHSILGRLPIAAPLLLLGGCSVFQADRRVQSTVTLEPGQSLAGEIRFEDGGDGYVIFSSEARKGHPAAPDAWGYRGDPEIRIALPDCNVAAFREERGLGYAQMRPQEGRPVRVVVRNDGTESKTFVWIVQGRADAVARWEAPRSDAAR